jgi:uncharacterized membrane protein YqjE
MSGPQKAERLAVSLKGFVSNLMELIQVRLELAGVEAREEVHRLGELLLYGALSVVFLGLGLVFFAVFLTVLLWDSHRLLALGVFAALFLLSGAAAVVAARVRFKRGSNLWRASIEELKRDRERLQQ